MVAFSITGNLVDVHQKKIYPGEVIVENGRIKSIKEIHNSPPDSYRDTTHTYILPGFIDAHVHIESSMLVPSEFARLAVVHGTVATVSDPHEIANVCGMKGVEFMIANGKTVPFKFHFGAPSCVPATSFETAGAVLDSNDVKKLLENDDIYYLSEMMNFPGVLNEDEEVKEKLRSVFGEGVYANGTLNRQYLSSIVFNDPLKLALLNSIVHPAVFRAFDAWVAQIKNAPYVMKEAALLFESTSYKMCDYSIMVTAPLELRIERVLKRDGLTRTEIESRNAKQFSEEKKTQLADFVVRNDDTELVIPQVMELHKQFLALATK